MRVLIGLPLVVALALQAGGTGPPAEVAAAAASLRADWIPPRPSSAPSGTEFAERSRTATGRQRQAAAVRELLSGNLPDFLRDLQPVQLRDHRPGGSAAPRATVWVMPDYLAVGSDEDFLRMPLTYPSAVAVAARLGFVLPTRKIVDAVYEQADVRLMPVPMPPDRAMRSTAYYLRHQQIIERQRQALPAGRLLAGHKKDVVITNRLGRAKGRIAIYGWHRRAGDPIQPLSTIHGSRYADYSHGLRLVHATAWIDGRPRAVVEVLEDPDLAPLLSYEGVIPNVRRLLDPAGVAAASP